MSKNNDSQDQNQSASKDTTAAASSSSADKEKAEQLEKAKKEREARAAAEVTESIATLTAKIAGLEKDKAGLIEQLEQETKRADEAEAARDQLRSALQQQGVSTLQLEQGQAQLTESVTVIVKGSRIGAQLGDVIIKGGSQKAVAETQAKVGKTHRVFALDAAQYDEIVNAKLATAQI